MAVMPQSYLLWLAEIHDGDVHVGRIIGWHTEEAGATEGVYERQQYGDRRPLPAPIPVVAFSDAAGRLDWVGEPRTGRVFIASTRDEAEHAGRAASPPGVG